MVFYLHIHLDDSHTRTTAKLKRVVLHALKYQQSAGAVPPMVTVRVTSKGALMQGSMGGSGSTGWPLRARIYNVETNKPRSKVCTLILWNNTEMASIRMNMTSEDINIL